MRPEPLPHPLKLLALYMCLVRPSLPLLGQKLLLRGRIRSFAIDQVPFARVVPQR